MFLSTFWPMAAFALAASISPGPVNLICLSCGIRYNLRIGLTFVTGATLGFVALFLAVGFGLHSLFNLFPLFKTVLYWSGIAFLLYLSVQLFFDKGELNSPNAKQPNFLTGAIMQWLNPKAWIASASGISAYTNGQSIDTIGVFALIYLPVCWLSLSCWVFSGAFLQQFNLQPKVIVVLNRLLALLLVFSCVYLLIEQ